ncbi:hypothetical protein JTE90_012417 [Oedothorax gibbosus]|uniref:Uncharacterized protein n=1 Tax=Oedothorax gibbosus TaxID=931172 RepID=A0AAV6TY32_9ARAC|nr:hypothetical protein JTE90_012417 [Oedothorax gibbosus]
MTNSTLNFRWLPYQLQTSKFQSVQAYLQFSFHFLTASLFNFTSSSKLQGHQTSLQSTTANSKDFQSCYAYPFSYFPQMDGFATEVPKRNSKQKTLNNSRSEHPGGLLHLGELAGRTQGLNNKTNNFSDNIS